MPKSPKECPRGAKDRQSDPKVVQKGTQRDPKGPQRAPNRHPNVTKMLPKRPLGNPRNSKSPIELSCESELMSGRKMSISLESEFDLSQQGNGKRVQIEKA